MLWLQGLLKRQGWWQLRLAHLLLHQVAARHLLLRLPVLVGPWEQQLLVADVLQLQLRAALHLQLQLRAALHLQLQLRAALQLQLRAALHLQR